MDGEIASGVPASMNRTESAERPIPTFNGARENENSRKTCLSNLNKQVKAIEDFRGRESSAAYMCILCLYFCSEECILFRCRKLERRSLG